ncbi:MAG: hypothetical protein VKK32_09175 [Candidatus Melainabacteria bacterium]|nr:hypothetical protein [Candidatus Melainabacteria bacterium]
MVIVPKELKELKAKVAALSKVNAAKKRKELKEGIKRLIRIFAGVGSDDKIVKDMFAVKSFYKSKKI